MVTKYKITSINFTINFRERISSKQLLCTGNTVKKNCLFGALIYPQSELCDPGHGQVKLSTEGAEPDR